MGALGFIIKIYSVSIETKFHECVRTLGMFRTESGILGH